MSTKTIIVGLGNPILTDDGVGVKVAYEIEARFRGNIPANLTITEASVGGLWLMELLEGYDRAIIIDAIQTRNGHPTGSIYTLNLADVISALRNTVHLLTTHHSSLRWMLA